MSAHNQNVNLDIGGLFGRAIDILKVDFVNWALIGLVGMLAFGCGGWGGYHYCVQKQLAGQKPEISDVLRPFSNLQLLIPLILIAVGCMLCVVPGLILAVWWAFAIPLMVQRDLDWKQAADMSKGAAMDNLGATILLLLVTGFVGGMGSAFFGLGQLITAPMAQIMLFFATMQFFGQSPTPQQLDYAPGAPAPMAPPIGAPHAVPAGPPPAAAPPAAAPPAAAPPAAAPLAAAPPAAAPPAAEPPAPAARETPTAEASTAEGEDDTVETAQQASAGEAVQGKTMAMSSVDFEAMLKNRNKSGDE